METPVPTVSTTEIIASVSSASSAPILKLRLQKKKSDRQVAWSESTVDNEHLNKKKSKCCCIYKKPLNFGESSSEEEEECEHCFGHPEKRVKRHIKSNLNQGAAVEKTDTATNSESTSLVNCDSGVCTLPLPKTENSEEAKVE